jgi:8-oxo-dGTP pyrophosphatase MutT (NUDIX family)
LNRSELINALQHYVTSYDEERAFISRFLELLKDDHAFQRTHLPGHITGSAWIVDETKNFVLLTHHAKLHRWLQPGGHADGDEDIYRVATREAREETGITEYKILSTTLFDIDIHIIPARLDFPEHHHYDIRLLLEASCSASLVVTEESHAVEWVPISEIASRSGHNHSMQRMSEKVKVLFAAQQEKAK